MGRKLRRRFEEGKQVREATYLPRGQDSRARGERHRQPWIRGTLRRRYGLFDLYSTDSLQVSNHSFKPSSLPEDDRLVDPQVLLPRLVPGDVNIGVLTPIYEPAREMTKDINETFSRFRLGDLL